MTTVEASYRYANSLNDAIMRALDSVREVYGIRKMTLNEKENIVRVEYDASRLKEPIVASLLRKAGMAIEEILTLI
jgi:hypothetical protein